MKHVMLRARAGGIHVRRLSGQAIARILQSVENGLPPGLIRQFGEDEFALSLEHLFPQRLQQVSDLAQITTAHLSNLKGRFRQAPLAEDQKALRRFRLSPHDHFVVINPPVTDKSCAAFLDQGELSGRIQSGGLGKFQDRLDVARPQSV